MAFPARRVGLIASMWSRARAASRTASMRPLSLEAVSGMVFQTASSTARTSRWRLVDRLR